MRIVGIDFRDGILFVPEVLLAANAMKGGMAILKPLLAETGAPRLGNMLIGTVKGDIEFGNNLRTENGADIDGYIKKTNGSKSKLTGDFLFKKKDKKDASEAEERPDVVNKEAIA